tara:strand:+ start:627 stop:845 length:219 start_codon:yes stop_codon:yes gene_type:complete
MIPFPFGQFTKEQMDSLQSEIEEEKKIKAKQKECGHPLNQIILERDYYGKDEDSDYTEYFKCDKCGEEVEAE